MGLLDHLWDDMMGGPGPDKKLKCKVLPRHFSTDMDQEGAAGGSKEQEDRRKSGEFLRKQDEAIRMTQSISIGKKPPSLDTDSLLQYSMSLPSGIGRGPSMYPSSPPALLSPTSDVSSPSPRKEEVWRSLSLPRKFHEEKSRDFRRTSSHFERVSEKTHSHDGYYDWYPGST
eukprot:TRINITY_DN6863_c0_g1_i1.p1 TRINITY_DN6863_c0_g1~~TRINITY_DN6863_c0_g1_i1.p1  ORF type:complete len:172 (-),score=31.19 TRINITY_DN6863_c0_g1_i1:1213-1728(-)